MKSGIWTRKTLIWLYHVLLIITPLIWTNSTSELFEFPKMLTVYVLSILVGGVFLVSRVVTNDWQFKKSWLDIPLLVFLLSQILATLFSMDSHTSLVGYYSRFHGGLYSSLAYLTLYWVYVNSFDWTVAKQHLRSLLIGGLLVSLYAIPEHFGVSLSCIVLGSGATADCWVQDVVSRVFGTLGQPNWLAAYLITIIFVPMASKPNNRVLNFFLVAIFFATILFTKSRSGLLGLAFGLMVFSALALFRKVNRKVVTKSLATYYLLLAVVFVVFGKSLLPIYDSLVANLTGGNSVPDQQVTMSNSGGTQLETGGTESGQIRRIVWQGAIDVWKRYPLFGSGVETFAFSYNGSRPVSHNLVSEWDFLYNRAHNEWLNLAATTGTLGLAVYLWIVGAFVIKAGKMAVRDGADASLLASLVAGFSALAVSNFFGFSTVSVGILFFLMPAMVIARNNEIKEVVANKIKPGQWGLVILVGLVVVLLLTQVGQMYQADRLYASGKKFSRNNQLTDAINVLNQAVKIQPREPVYKDELSKTAAKVALGLNDEGESEAAIQFAQLAVGFNRASLLENPYYLPFYKTGANVLANMAVFDENYLSEAESLLQKAAELAPTDPKIKLTLGLIYIQQGRLEEAQFALEKAVELKPNYEQARYSLGLVYQDLEKNDKAREHYEYILKHISPGSRPVLESLEELDN